MLFNWLRGRSFDIESTSQPAYLIPSSSGWNLVRYAPHNNAWEVRALDTLEEAGGLLRPDENFILGLPIALILAQRLRLPTVDREEFAEMVRIQIEKAMPYSAEEVTIDSELIGQTEQGSVISAVAVHNEKLS